LFIAGVINTIRTITPANRPGLTGVDRPTYLLKEGEHRNAVNNDGIKNIARHCSDEKTRNASRGVSHTADI